MLYVRARKRYYTQLNLLVQTKKDQTDTAVCDKSLAILTCTERVVRMLMLDVSKGNGMRRLTTTTSHVAGSSKRDV